MADVAKLTISVSANTAKAVAGMSALNAQLHSFANNAARTSNHTAGLTQSMHNAHGASQSLSISISEVTNNLNQSGSAASRSAGGMGRWAKIAMAATAAAIVLQPAVQGLGAVLGGLTSVLATTGVAGGVFGVALVGATKRANENKKAVNKAAAELLDAEKALRSTKEGTDAHAKALERVTAAQAMFRSAQEQLTASQRQWLASTRGLKEEWTSFLDATESSTLPVAAIAVDALSGALGKLKPLVAAVAPIAESFALSLQHWVNTRLDSWVSFFSGQAGPVLTSIIKILTNVGATIGQVIKQFSAFGQSMTSGLADLTEKMAVWANSGGFTQFLERVKANGPVIKEFFTALKDALSNINAVMASMGPNAMTLATIFLKIVAAMPPSVIEALIYAWLALKAAMAISGAINATISAFQNLNRGITAVRNACIGTRIQLAALAIQQRAAAAGAAIAAGAQRAWAAAVAFAGRACIGTRIQLLMLTIQQAASAIAARAVALAQRAWAAAMAFAGNACIGTRIQLLMLTIQQTASAIAANAVAMAQRAWAAAVAFAGNACIGTRVQLLLMRAAQIAQAAATGIVTAAQWAWNAAMSANPIAIVIIAIAALVAAIVWIATQTTWFQTAWKYTWNAVKEAASAVWNFVRDNIFNPIVTFFTQTIPGAAAAFVSLVMYHWNTFRAGLSIVWNFVRDNIINPIVRFFTETIPNAAQALKDKVVEKFNMVRAAVATIIDGLKRNVLEPIVRFFTETVPNAAQALKDKVVARFRSAVDTLKGIWDRLEGIFKAPIKFFVDVVINKGVIKAINWVIDKLGGDANTISPVSLPGFASGGYVSGPGTSRSDSIPARLSNGEYVMSAEAVRRIGVHRLNAMNHGSGNDQTQPQLANLLGGAAVGNVTGGFAEGGLTAGDLAGLFGNLAKGIAAAGGGILGNLIKGGSDFLGGALDFLGLDKAGDAVKGAGDAISTAIMMWSRENFEEAASGVIDLVSKKLLPGVMKVAGSFPLSPIGGGAGTEIGKGFLTNVKDKIADFLFKKKDEQVMSMTSVAGAQSVQAWAPLARIAMIMGGLNPAQLPKFLALMAAESGGNPNARNGWDSNAAAGMASVGLMQVIPPTFQAYHVAGTSWNILDPLANMAAAANYIRHVYGGNVPGSPYKNGTNSATPGWHLVGEQGPELVNFGGGEKVLNNKNSALAVGGGGGDTINVNISSGVIVRSQQEAEDLIVAAYHEAKRKGRIRP